MLATMLSAPKAEEITQPYETRQHAYRGIASYIHGFYNPVRLHSSLGYIVAQRICPENEDV